jgi:hypothetical protein
MQLNLVWHLSGLSQIAENHVQTGVVSCKRHSSPAVVKMLPLTDLKPTDDSCVYSTLLFVSDQAKKLKMLTACITFDQPLC